MNRLGALLIFGGLTAVTVWAQHAPLLNTGPVMQPPANAYPYGNILFPGGIPTHPPNLGTSVSGILPKTYGPGGVGLRGGQRRGPDRQRTIIVPYGVPVYYGNDYYGDAQQQSSPNITVVVPQQPTPMVIINQHYTPETADPAMHDYSAIELPPPASSSGTTVSQAPMHPTFEPARKGNSDEKATIYLIALKDSSIHQAVGYWTEHGTLNYVTPQGTINRVTLSQLDKELTEQLNSERSVEFQLNGVDVRK
jgi:hypothetical protein